MTTNREAVAQIEPISSSVPLNTAGPLTEAQMAGKTHIVEKRQLRFVVESVSGHVVGTYPLWTVPPGVHVLSVDALIITGFTGSVTLAIEDAAAWVATDDWSAVVQNAGSLVKSVLAGEANQNGKYFAATDTIDLVIAGATALAGEVAIEITFIDWNKYKAATLA